MSPARIPLLASDVSLKDLSPTLNAGFPETLGSGIANVPVTLPPALVNNGSPAAGVL